ncbi:MAG: AAA family ATPase [Methanobrevibacter sp.]|jgi:predicted ATPase|nr:AAA family ATPase [Candidatus Methanoflexus mossambicus]
MITKIKVSNFKSFKDFKTDLSNLNVIVGANGSGKSNFINIFKFLRDIVDSGLDEAINNQGGLKYFRNLSIMDKTPTKFYFNFEVDFNFSTVAYSLNISNIEYDLNIKYSDDLDYDIEYEKIRFKSNINNETIFFELNNLNRQLNAFSDSKENIFNIEEIFPSPILDVFQRRIDSGEVFSLLETPLIELPFNWGVIFKNIGFYDIEPKKAKEIASINGKNFLKESGENLAVIVDEIVKDNDKKRKFLNLIKFFIPAIENIDSFQYCDSNSIYFKIKERFFDPDLPSQYISDGTNYIIAIIVALCFSLNNPVFIEEIDKNIHPKLISTLILLINEVLDSKQVFITTHNSEILKYIDINVLYLIKRDFNGFSTITKPAHSKEVKSFLDEEIGIEELFSEDLLM